MSNAKPDSNADAPKPKLRHAKVITLTYLRSAARSGSPEELHYALIDGCRSLNPDRVYPIARKALEHSSPRVRWAALFAIEYLASVLADRIGDRDQPILRIARIACDENEEEDVRSYAVDVLTSVIFALEARTNTSRL